MILGVTGCNLFNVNLGFQVCLERVISSSLSENGDRDALGAVEQVVLRLAWVSKERTDILVKLGTVPICLVEMKLPSAFRANLTQNASSVVDGCKHWSLAVATALSFNLAPVVFSVVQQLFHYLIGS